MVSSISGNTSADGSTDELAEWIQEFLTSQEHQALLPVQLVPAQDIILLFSTLMNSGYHAAPKSWNEENVSECALYLIPEAIRLHALSPATVTPVLSAFFQFLDRKQYLSAASPLKEIITSLEPEIIRRSRFPLYWILKKKFIDDVNAQGEPSHLPSAFSDQAEYERYLYQCLFLVVENWGMLFAQSDQYKLLDTGYQEQSEYIISSITDACLIYYKKRPQEWDVDTISNCLLDLYPRDAIESPEFFAALVPVLSAFFRFLAQQELHDTASEIASHIESIAQDVVKHSGDPAFWSKEKLTSIFSTIEWDDPQMEGKVKAYLASKKRRDQRSSVQGVSTGERVRGVRKPLPPRGKGKKKTRKKENPDRDPGNG